jgi:hypothetical protein
MSKTVTSASRNQATFGMKAAKAVAADATASGKEWGTAYLRWVRQQWDAAITAAETFQEAVVPKSLLEEVKSSDLSSEFRNAARRSASLAMDAMALYAIAGTKWFDPSSTTSRKTVIPSMRKKSHN